MVIFLAPVSIADNFLGSWICGGVVEDTSTDDALSLVDLLDRVDLLLL